MNFKKLKKRLNYLKSKTKRWAKGEDVKWRNVKYTGDGIYNMSNLDFNTSIYFYDKNT